jgi:outer membrane protein
MMTNKVLGTVAAVLMLGSGLAQAQETTIKFGVTRYDTHAKTSGISGVGVPAGADASVGDATTVIFVAERALTPNIGVELVLGVPPKIKSRAAGSVSYLGEVMSARNVAPTLVLNYHFGQPGDTWRPYAGLGINYTRFVDVKSTLAEHVEMSDSVGPMVQVGIDYFFNKQWGLFASVAALKVKSDLVATGSTVLTTTIDFRPIVYSAGVSYRF